MSYGIRISMQVPFAEAVPRVREALKAQGFASVKSATASSRRVEFALAQVAAQPGLGLYQRLEFGHGVHVCEHFAGRRAEQVHYLRIEVLAPTGPGHLDGGVGAACPVEHLDGVGEVE